MPRVEGKESRSGREELVRDMMYARYSKLVVVYLGMYGDEYSDEQLWNFKIVMWNKAELVLWSDLKGKPIKGRLFVGKCFLLFLKRSCAYPSLVPFQKL